MIYRFSGFELDTRRRELRRAGDVVALAPKPFSVLTHLVERRDRMVPKSELLDAFWSADVSEAALQTAIRSVRKALGKGPGAAAVRTYHGQGFRFVALVEAAPETSAPPPAEAGAPRGAATPRAAFALRERRLVAVLSVRFRPAPPDRGDAGALDTILAFARTRIEADHGRLLHMMVDGFTAVFGLGPHAEDGARRAAACAWDIAAAGPVAAPGRAVGYGVESGPVTLDEPDGDGAWSLPGAIERRASELAEDAGCGEILLGAAARQRLRGDVETRETPAGHVLARAPVPGAGIAPRGRDRDRPSRFVGREAELAFLARSAGNALAGSGQAAVLSGPAGIGKSRLTREFLGRLAPGAPTVATAQCLPRLAGTPLAPVRRLCRALFPAAAAAPVAVACDAADRAILVLLLDAAAPPGEVLESLSEQDVRLRSRALFVRMIAARCAQGPLALVVEDTHWLDPASRGHLAALAAEADRLPLLLIFTARPGEDAPLSETVLHLAPLGRGDSLALLETAAGVHRPDGAAARVLVERAAGNPFFLEELARASVDAADPDHDLPHTVQAAVEARIAALDPFRRGLLYALAVLGLSAPADRVAALLGAERLEAAAGLGRLLRDGFVEEHADGVAFRHMLLQETAYAMISPPDRARLHGDAARQLEDEETRGAAAVLPETLAWHWQEAGETARAVVCWTRASNAAISRAAGPAAIAFAQKGLALVDPSDPEAARQELGLQLSLAPALMARLGYGAEEVGRAYLRALDLSVRTGSTRARLRALLGMWVHAWVAGRLTEALAHGREILDLAERSGDPALLLQGHGGIGAVLMHTGALAPARGHLEAGMQVISAHLPEAITMQNSAVTCAAYAAWVAALQGRTAAMRDGVACSQALSLRLDNPFASAIHLALCAGTLMSAGDAAACAPLAEQAVAVSRAHRFPFWLGTGLVQLGWALARQGRPEEALETVAEGIAVFEATGARVQRANWHGVKAEILLSLDRPEEGLLAVATALDSARGTGDIWFTPRLHAIAAALQGRRGDHDAMRSHAAKARRLATEHGAEAAFILPPQ